MAPVLDFCRSFPDGDGIGDVSRAEVFEDSEVAG